MSLAMIPLEPPPKTRDAFTDFATRRLLVIDDDYQLIPLIGRAAQQIDPDLVIDWACGAQEARMALCESRYQAALVDFVLPGSESGFSIAKEIELRQPGSRIAMMSALPISIPSSCRGFLLKPFGLRECRHFLSNLIYTS